MSWQAVVLWLAVAISAHTPDACLTAGAEDFGVSLAIGEGYLQPQLAHELIYGAYMEHGCRRDANFFSSYGAALSGAPYHWRAFFQPGTFDLARVAYLHALWRDTLGQHYRIAHFAVKLPSSWCARGKVRVGDMEYC